MRCQRVLLLLFCTAIGACAKTSSERQLSEPTIYTGISGASAGAPLNNDLFVVADDESSQLRIYSNQRGGPPLQVIDLSSRLEVGKRAETDIEGAAQIGDRVYWITSHSRNNKGNAPPSRSRFFATHLRSKNGTVEISFVGRPYRNLLQDMAAAESLRALNLGAASRLPPKAKGGLNIEGLCATPENHLLIGFRSPNPGGNALLVPLQNPDEVVSGKPPRFGAPIQLDLNGLGIRDIVFWHDRYLIVAGSYDGSGKSRLYSWSGGAARPRYLKAVNLKGLNPEAVIVYPDKGWKEVQLLSDDSNSQSGIWPQFRSVWANPDVAD